MRVLIAKTGLDGHDRGARLVARLLMENGHEVVYTGLRQTTEKVVAAAEQEDVAVIGVSVLSGGHVEIARDLVAELKRRGIDDIGVVLGGVIPAADIDAVIEAGADAVIRPGASTQEILDTVAGAAKEVVNE